MRCKCVKLTPCQQSVVCLIARNQIFHAEQPRRGASGRAGKLQAADELQAADKLGLMPRAGCGQQAAS